MQCAGEQPPGNPDSLPFGRGELRGEDAAADLQPHGGIAERREGSVRETVFARDLAHHLHQPPENARARDSVTSAMAPRVICGAMYFS